MAKPRFVTRQPSFWTAHELDIAESNEDAASYDAEVLPLISRKVQTSSAEAKAPHNTSIDHEPHQTATGQMQGESALRQQAVATDPAHDMAAPSVVPTPMLELNQIVNTQPIASQQLSIAVPNVSRLRSGKSVSTPVLSRLLGHTTLPSVPSPKDFSTPLPLPRPTSRLQAIQTPDLASPIDTPNHLARPGTDALGTPIPIPLGTDPHASIKGKKEYLKLTEHFADFSKTVSKDAEAANASALSSRGRAWVGGRAVPALGGKVFAGLRFCIPPELGPVTKHKQRWEVVTKLGGQVTLQPDTATTHVIYDKSSASMLARELGLGSINNLPDNTLCVRWGWVVACKLAGALVESTAYNSFPKTAFTRTQSAGARLPAFHPLSKVTSDTTNGLGGKSISISKKREHTASDSDTESPRRSRMMPVAKSAILPTKASIIPRSNLSRLPTIATSHVLPTGPGWETTPNGEQDGLDEMISGVVNGTVDQRAMSDIAEDEEVNDAEGVDSVSQDAGHPFRCGQKNDGASKTGPNEWLAKKFDDMHDMYQGVQGKNAFAIRQYMQAASILRRTLVPIRSGAEARKIKGVGQGMADRIDEFISGAPGRQFYEDNEQTRAIAAFKDIYGVGRTFANELYKRGARTMDDLRTHDYGLTSGQVIGVELYDDLNSRIPREECRQLYEIIRAEAVTIDPKIWIEIMGSYRRGQETSGDVDILITRDTADGLNHSGVIKKLVDRLQTRGIITHDLSMPHDWKALEAKWMGVGRLDANSKHRRIDILCIPFEQWGAALIYFTGNEIFNRSLRLYARKKGYSLNQRGLSAGVIRDRQGLKMTEGNIIASRTEQDIFDVLGLRWRHPHHRRP